MEIQSINYYLIALITSITSAGVNFLRNIPNLSKNYFRKAFTVSYHIPEHNSLYYYFEYWASNNNIYKNQNVLVVKEIQTSSPETNKVSSPHPIVNNNTGGKKNIIFGFPQGTYKIKYNNKTIWISSQEESKNNNGNVNQSNAKKYILTTIGRNKDFLNGFIDILIKESEKLNQNKIILYSPNQYGEGWNFSARREKRNIDSVISNKKEEIIKDINEFKSKKEWYNNFGIPYKRTYLLYGSPGTGKTSLIHALASYYNMNIYNLALSTITSDMILVNTINKVDENDGILLIEDLHTIFNKTKIILNGEDKILDNKPTITYNCFLNTIDGLLSKEGLITFITTNNIDYIDDALMRNGRIDVKVKIDNATQDEIKQMFLKFFPNESDLAEYFSKQIEDYTFPMCSIQEHLILNKDNLQSAKEWKPVIKQN